MQMMFGRNVAFGIGALARLGAPDHMSETPMPVESIAAKCEALPDRLYRLLRMLASIGVVAQDGRNFALTPVSALLRKDAPGSLHNMAVMFTDHWVTNAYINLAPAIRDGRDGVTHAFGKNAWELFPEIPEQAHRFQLAMTDFTANLAGPLLDAYDFSSIATLADVGGGHGTLIAAILKRYPTMQGVLFDLEPVIDGAKSAGLFAGCENRIRYEVGSFLETAPSACDAYIMKHIIHDWDDERCRTILSHIRKQMAPHGKVLLYEMVVPETNDPDPSKMLDIEMLIATAGGKERTAVEFEALIQSAGLRLARIVPTHSPMSLIEATL